MFIPLLVFVSALVLPSLGFAAYQNPVITSNVKGPSGTTEIGFSFSGNAGEPTVTRKYYVSSSSTFATLRNWVDETIKELDAVYLSATAPAVQPGQVVLRLARVEPSPTAKQVWMRKFHLYMQGKDSGIAALSSLLTTMKADLEATYQSGFFDGNP